MSKERFSRVPRARTFILSAAGALLLTCTDCSTAKDEPVGPTAPDGPPITTPGPVDDPRKDPPAKSADGLVETRRATPLGLDAFSANGGINPKGKPATYHFEYGPTVAYGSKTAEQAVAPKLAAHYRETYKVGRSGFSGGMDGQELTYMPTGGASDGYVKFAGPTGDDAAHSDGIGANELLHYIYMGTFIENGDVPNPSWAAGLPDLRDAKISLSVRGNAWDPRGSEVVFWMQSDSDLPNQYDNDKWRAANWALTGTNLTDAILMGGWQKVEYRLTNDTNAWTWAGHYVAQERPNYIYWSLDESLGRISRDVFHMAVFVSNVDPPTGGIDFDDYEITYRNHSLVFPPNGGTLVSAPAGGDNPALLTDGWRNGEGKTWRSAPAPQAPLEFVYSFKKPIDLNLGVQIHQNPDWPSKEVQVLASKDGVNYVPVAEGIIPESHPWGPNFAFFLQTPALVAQMESDGSPVLHWPDELKDMTHVKVRVLSGYKSEYWGLGEIELFGAGAVKETDDELYNINQDIVGLTPGTTYHYRLVETNASGQTSGGDKTFTVPAINKPDVMTGAASRIKDATAKLEGRIAPLGLETQFWFEYGTDVSYGAQSVELYGGLEPTPRTVTAMIDGLTPGATYHYRLVAKNKTGTSYGGGVTFVAK